ncbi:hypothetical protein BDV96DRAFT_647575 [Lophiotrema nucula]|uniref:DOMON domain-containing protein n=1 Tax=Lophiotrema nucula TaxID=690887 RepID=A0A6A5Z3N1_9PLEO|nr:hypothetical protein BDV96DRAFT_647575 [Lophiotrema nucula]
MLRRRFDGVVAVLFALLSVFPTYTLADNPPASTLWIEETETQFSINLPVNSDDVLINFTSPAYSWVGVGFGEGMKDSLMFIMYLSENGKNVTVSPRIATGHSEPSHFPNCTIEYLPGTGIHDEMFVLNARAKNCKVWPGGNINVDDTKRPMIYAFGPGNSIQSNSLNAPLKRHFKYGKFTMDIKAAQDQGPGEVPPGATSSSGVTLEGGMTRDHDRMNLAHAVLGCIAMFVFWPINVFIAGFFRNIKIHIGMSVFIMIFLILAYGLGIGTSSEYNRSKHFNSAHQIMAFIALLPILLLSLLPLRPLARLHKLIPRIHTPIASITLVFLILTGGLGLHLSSSARPIIIAYIAVSLIVFFPVMLLQTCIRRRGSAYARATTRRRLGEEDEEDLVLAAYMAGRKLDGRGSQGESRSESAASFQTQSSHERSGSGGSATNIYGGGTMPGPQYLLNMHPGVPVHKW